MQNSAKTRLKGTIRKLKIIELLRENPKTSIEEIAEKLGFHRNTIGKDVKWLNENIAEDFTLLTNKIISRLNERINNMSDHNLILFFSKLHTQKIEHKIEGGKQPLIIQIIDEKEDAPQN